MKKYALLLLLGMCIFLITTPVLAEDQSDLEFFGIGADIKQVDQTTFQISPEGKKQNEGFAISSIKVNGGQQMTFQSNFKGKGALLVKITETDEKGRFIKESISKPIELTSNWDMNRTSTMLAPETTHIQIMFLTNEKQSQVFYIKNIRIQKHEQPTL